MRAPRHRTAPDHDEKGWPRGIPYIIGNEGCERFSFYGMKSILYSYLATLYCAPIVRERAMELEACRALEDQAARTALQDSVLPMDVVAEGALKAAEDQGTAVVHFFITGVYAMPMIGAIIADRFLGKYRTIIWLSLVYCAGHACLAIFEGQLWGIYLGLGLIAVGSGGIKPCVSAHVGDQFGRSNWDKVQRAFAIFYFIINFGSFFATLIIPWTKETYGWSWAFAIPGILMFLATIAFWMGRNVFVHVPPKPGGRLGLLDAASSAMLFMTVGSFFFTAGQPGWVMAVASVGCLLVGLALFSLRQRIEPDTGFLATLVYLVKVELGGKEEPPLPGVEADPETERERGFFGPAFRRFGRESAEGPIAVLKIISVFLLVSVFWSLFDQHSSSWIRQAGQMDLVVQLPWGGEITLLKEQIGALNPLMVMMLIPFAQYVVYPGLKKVGFEMTPLRRMTGGMLIAAASFVAVALIQAAIDEQGNGVVPVEWQVIPYLVITLAEVMVSITGLEFAYTQAPRRMKSTIMGFWLLTVSLGNVITGLLAAFGGLELQAFFWTFAGLMAAAGVLFGVRAMFYRTRDYPQ